MNKVMKYQIGDRVRIKSLEWYNKNKDDNREIKFENGIFTTFKSTFLGQIMTIEEITPEKQYIFMEDRYKTLWTDEMIEGLVEEEVDLIPKFGEFSDNEPLDIPTMTTEFVKEHGLPCPDGYIFKDEHGNVINATKIVLEKKKKEYPKTFEECCKILGLLNVDLCFNADYRSFDASKEQWKRLGLMNQFYQLLICRDAYWKLYGEEMGLGKPWKTDWTANDNHFYTIHTFNGKIECSATAHRNAVLIFPTEEMRDAFYENFKELINECKELL